jgi:hypothetical protein
MRAHSPERPTSGNVCQIKVREKRDKRDKGRRRECFFQIKCAKSSIKACRVLCIPLKPHGTPGQAKSGLTPISCHAVQERSACASFIKERRMECINATSLHRKSGQWGTQHLGGSWFTQD